MEFLDNLLLVLAGAALGIVGTILTTTIRTKSDRQRALLEMAIQAAIEDFKADRDSSSGSNKSKILPMSSYVYFHFHYFKLLEDGKCTPSSLDNLNLHTGQILEVVERGPWVKSFLDKHTTNDKGNS